MIDEDERRILGSEGHGNCFQLGASCRCGKGCWSILVRKAERVAGDGRVKASRQSRAFYTLNLEDIFDGISSNDRRTAVICSGH